MVIYAFNTVESMQEVVNQVLNINVYDRTIKSYLIEKGVDLSQPVEVAKYILTDELIMNRFDLTNEKYTQFVKNNKLKIKKARDKYIYLQHF